MTSYLTDSHATGQRRIPDMPHVFVCAWDYENHTLKDSSLHALGLCVNYLTGCV